MDSNRLLEQYRSLVDLPADAPPLDKRKRGRAFEQLLKSLLARDDLAPRIRIVPSGEEIDGSFALHDRVYLLEAKWHSNPPVRFCDVHVQGQG
jgi:hypothetical protein